MCGINCKREEAGSEQQRRGDACDREMRGALQLVELGDGSLGLPEGASDGQPQDAHG